MIPVLYSDEPARLAAIRERGLAGLAAFTVSNPPAEVPDTYRRVADDLWRMQHHKCCYCEKLVETSFNDVEHYRPKLRAERQPGSDAVYGYWWLAWTWRNLLFACPQCNRSGKNDAFPLSPGSAPLLPGEQPPGSEQPLLPHPGEVDPLESIRFVPVVRNDGDVINWEVVPRDGSETGAVAIRVLKLNRPDLRSLRDAFFREWLRGDVDDLRQAMDSGDPERFRDEWFVLMVRRLRAQSSFAGFTHDVYDHFFPEDERRRMGVVLRRPGQQSDFDD